MFRKKLLLLHRHCFSPQKLNLRFTNYLSSESEVHKSDLMNRIASFLWTKLSTVVLTQPLNVKHFHQNKREVNWRIRTNQTLLIILLYFLWVQHVSGTTMPIIRSSRKDQPCSSPQPAHYSSLPAPNFQPTENHERNDQCGNQHHGRELLMMGVVMPETCLAYKKYNK